MKLRLRYAKRGKVRFVGNLDVMRIWERALRKAALPVAYSTGFSPRPRLGFGLALPMAAESVAEYVDIELAAQLSGGPDGVEARLNEALPPGFTVLVAVEKQPGQVSLQQDVVACDWELELTGLGGGEAARAVDEALAAAVLPLERERKGERRVDDVRSSIEDLALDTGSVRDRVVVHARLATLGRGLRPSELVRAVWPAAGEDTVCRVLRTEQWIEREGVRRELLPLPAALTAPESGA